MNLLKILLISVLFVIGFVYSGVEGQSLACPAVRTTSGWLDLFPLPCRKNSECKVMTNQHLCCKGFCTKGVKAAVALKSTTSEPSLSSIALSSELTSTSTATETTSTAATTTTTTSTAATTTTTTSTTTTTTPSTTTTTTPSTTTTTTPSTTTSTTPSTTSSTTTTTTTTTTPKPTTTRAPTESPLQPFLQFLPIQRVEASTVQTSAPAKISKTGNGITSDVSYSHTRNSLYVYNEDYSSAGKSNKLVCPKPGQAPVLLFPIPCEKNSQCRASSGADHVCCDGRCIRGVPAPKPTTTPAPVSHQPLLGVIPRECPSAPLGELLFEVQSCKSDADCWPRVCCPDGKRSYCRTARARLDLVPIANQIDGPVRMLESYLQCTPPPQYDLFPQKCSSSVDCFPNLCCAEGGKKHCRPPQRSLLALLAGVTQRVGSTIGNMRQARNNRNNA